MLVSPRIHHTVHEFSPVYCHRHSVHLYHGGENVIEICLVFKPEAAVVEAVGFGVDVEFGVALGERCVSGFAVERAAFEELY